MHSGLARPRALQGVNAHQARVSNPEPSHAFLAGGDERAVALDDCALGRAVRWRSRGAGRAACGAAALGRCATIDAVSAATPGASREVCCASAFSQSETLSGLGERIHGSSAVDADGADVARVVAAGVTAGVVGSAAGVAVALGDDVATTFVGTSVAPAVAAASTEGGPAGRLRDHAPHPNATIPVKASASAALR